MMRKYYTSSVMRLITKLRIYLHKMIAPPEEPELANYLSQKYFDNIVAATHTCALQDADCMGEVGAPYNAIKLGYELKGISAIALGVNIIRGDGIRRHEL